MINDDEKDLFQELRNYKILSSGKLVLDKIEERESYNFYIIKIHHEMPLIFNPYEIWTRKVSKEVSIDRIIFEVNRYSNLEQESLKMDWLWCDLCDHAIIICPKCDNTSCNGGGCDSCWYDFELATYLSSRSIHKYKDQMKIINRKDALDELFKSRSFKSL